MSDSDHGLKSLIDESKELQSRACMLSRTYFDIRNHGLTGENTVFLEELTLSIAWRF